MTKCRLILILTMIITGCDIALAQGYGGPSMLSRGGNTPGKRGRSPMDIIVYGALRGTVETGLTPVLLNSDGSIPSDTVYGVQGEIGVYGTHNWRRTSLGLDYRGDYRWTSSLSYYNGTNQALSINLGHTLTRRTALNFRLAGGTTNRAFGGFAAPAVADPDAINLVNNEVFDSRVYFASATTGVTYRQSARLSYDVFVNGNFVKRPDNDLVGSMGYTLSAASDYRLSSRTSIGAGYMYLHYSFPRVYGNTHSNAVFVRTTRRMTRNIGVSISGGIYNLVATGTESVQLSPEVAALLGVSTGVAAYRRESLLPLLQAGLSYEWERSRLSVMYATGITPGNGVYQTSQSEAFAAGYSFAGTRKLSFGASARYSEFGSKSIEVDGQLKSSSAGGGLNYVLTRMLNLSAQMDYRTFDSPGLQGREGFALSFGISLSPARFPLSIW